MVESITDLSMQGKVCLVTGATQGIGMATALGLARKGAEVLIISRNSGRIANTLAVLREVSGNPNVHGFQANLSSQLDVRRVVQEILAKYSSLDVLINNVGATLLSYQTSIDGYEMTWALNYLNHFLITHLLLDALKTAADRHGEARIVELTSSIYWISKNNFDHLQKKERYNGVMAYAHTKRAVILYTQELSRRLEGSGVTINAVTPGLVETGIAEENGWFISGLMWLINRFALPLEKGVQPILRLATSPDMRGVSGKYFYQFNTLPVWPKGENQETRQKLWQLSRIMLGMDPEVSHN